MLCLGWVDGGAGMTENEAIELLKKANRDNDMICILPKSDMGKCLIQALEEVQQYRTIGTLEECRAAVEKQTPKSRIIIEGKYFCPVCKNLMKYPGYCGCGQRVY